MRRSLFFVSILWATAVTAEPLIIDNGRLFIQAKVNGVATEALLAEGAVSEPPLSSRAMMPIA